MNSPFAFGNHFKAIFKVPNNTFACIDGIRALGMFCIIIGHTASYSAMMIDFSELQNQVDKTPFWFGWVWNAHYWVDLFFMMSVFLIASLLMVEFEKNNSIDVTRFYVRRFFRLMPVYFVVVVFFYLVGLPNKENLWWNLLYINNFFDHGQTAAPWTWSLAVEEQFYLIFPLLFIYLASNPKKRFQLLTVLFFTSFLVRGLVLILYPELYKRQLGEVMADHDFQNLYFSVIYDNLYTRFGAFIAGIGGAYLYMYHREETKRFLNSSTSGTILIALSLIASFLILASNVQKSQISFPEWFVASYYIGARNILALSIMTIVLAIMTGNKIVAPIRWILNHKIWYAPAQLTYSAYLIHLVFVAAILFNVRANYDARGGYDYTDPMMLSLTVFLSIVITYSFAAILYVFIEKPLIVYRNNLTHQKNFNEEEKTLAPVKARSKNA